MTKSKTPDENRQTEQEAPARKPKKRLSKRRKTAALVLLASLLIPFSYAGYIYAASPAVIRNPQQEHYHFRMQILVDGKAENFAEDKYQKDYNKNQCTAELPEQPIHFHDGKDQFTHIHWEGMTGGMVMKYYGWDYIGGINGALGYKLDDLKNILKVNTHGNFLPPVPEDAKFYVYTGDKNGYQQKSFDDWANRDLEQFFGTTSNLPIHERNQQTSLLDSVLPKAYAHGAEGSSQPANGTEMEEQKLTRINNLIGNVVIFVQKDKPSNERIKERFNRLEPLSDSVCGG